MTTDKLEKLKAKRAAIELQIRREMGRERSQTRRQDTRRKILAGAAILDEAESEPEVKAQVMRLLGRFLVRDDDRELFGLPPIPPPPKPAPRKQV